MPDTRVKVPRAVTGVAFDGVTGRVSFDGNGDTLDRRLTVYTVKDGRWAMVTSGTAAR